jgi:hypothetical protein
MNESIWECFHVVRDPRVERTRDHELHDPARQRRTNVGR